MITDKQWSVSRGRPMRGGHDLLAAQRGAAVQDLAQVVHRAAVPHCRPAARVPIL